ncbi:MAG TPA: hypothetical protein VMD29_02545 [Terracidiphilus sp.]|nr:hypothetical protein [Terracidiphilus sp.]
MGGIASIRSTIPFLVFPLATFHFAAAQEWHTYSYPADGFSISAPAQPVTSRQDVADEERPMEMHNYVLDLGTAALYASASENAMPATSNLDEALKGAENGAVESVHGHLVSDRRIALGSYPGVEMEADSDSAHFTARIYIVRSKLYLTLVISAPGKPYPDATRFLDSFRLLPPVNN